MICNLCGKNEATIIVEKIFGAKREKLGICRECAQKNNVTRDPKSLQKVFDLFEKTQAASKVCPVCGTNVSEIEQHLMAGCSECYTVFSKQIKGTLKFIGSSANFSGSLPQKLKGFKSVLTDRMMLEQKLQEAVKKEDYEKAAMYRDYLKALESRPQENGNDVL